MDLFERIRREHFIDGDGVRLIARRYGIHRRMVRQALASAEPAPRKTPIRMPTALTPALQAVINMWLEADRTVKPKQRHSARRIFTRLVDEHGFDGAESTVRAFVGRRKRELAIGHEVFVPRDHAAGQEAEVDWYEAQVDFPAGRQTVQFFQMRACFSGREFHMAFPRATQQAFLEGHVAALGYFGGVFARLRYDNLKAAIKRILRGRSRAETQAFITLRSHYLFESEFCRPGREGAHEKGGVENGAGRFRRNHLVPIPAAEDFAALNAWLVSCCARDDERRIEGRAHAIAQDWQLEREHLRALPASALSTAEVSNARVDQKSRVCVRTNRYSVPVGLAARKVEVRLHAQRVEIFHGGRLVASHQRLHGRHGEQLELDHYLELLQHKPGALASARPLRQARDAGRFPPAYERLWSELRRRYGESEGSRQMVDVLLLHRQAPVGDVHMGVELALEYGSIGAEAVALVLRQLGQAHQRLEALPALGELGRYERPASRDLGDYDALLPGGRVAVEVQA